MSQVRHSGLQTDSSGAVVLSLRPGYQPNVLIHHLFSPSFFPRRIFGSLWRRRSSFSPQNLAGRKIFPVPNDFRGGGVWKGFLRQGRCGFPSSPGVKRLLSVLLHGNTIPKPVHLPQTQMRSAWMVHGGIFVKDQAQVRVGLRK